MGGNSQASRDFFLGLSDSVAGFQLNQLQQRNQRRAQNTSAIVAQLAQDGALADLPSDVQRGFSRVLGKDVFQGFLEKSGINQQLNAPVDTLRQGVVDILQEPIQALQQSTVNPQTGQSVIPQQILQAIGQAGQQGQSAIPPAAARQIQQQAVTKRAPSAAEQFRRFQGLGPLGVGLLAGTDLGQLSAVELRQRTKQLAETAHDKRVVDTFILRMHEQGRRVGTVIPRDQFNEDDIPDGFIPAVTSQGIIPIQAKDPEFNFSRRFQDEARALGVEDLKDLTQKQAEQIQQRIYSRELSVSAAKGAQAARIARDAAVSNPLFLTRPDHSFFDARTGQRVPSTFSFGEVAPHLKGEGGRQQQNKNVVELTKTERGDLEAIKEAQTFFNSLARAYQSIYGPGGAFENLQAQGRLQAGVKGGLARLLQTDPDLAAASRIIQGNAANIATSLGGVKGVQSDRDVANAQKLLSQPGALIPDTPEVAFALLDNVKKNINAGAQRILRNKNFEFDLVETGPQAAPQRLARPQEVQQQIDNNTGKLSVDAALEHVRQNFPDASLSKVRQFLENTGHLIDLQRLNILMEADRERRQKQGQQQSGQAQPGQVQPGQGTSNILLRPGAPGSAPR